jgi:hypothetical protein
VIKRAFHKFPAKVFVASVFYWAFLGCQSYTEETQEMRSKFVSQDYANALKSLETSSIKTQDRNRLLYHLEAGMIRDRLHEQKDARRHLLQADKIADELYTVSVTRSAASYVVNDAATDYGGEDYEKVAIHTMLALSYIEDGELSAALVEARKINSKLYEINQAYGSDGNKYGEDAFARYLSGVIYEAEGKDDDAIIDYKKALELYAGSYAKFYSGSVPDSLIKALYRLAKERGRATLAAELEKTYPAVVRDSKKELAGEYGELVVIHEIGNIAIKKNEEFALPIGRQIVRFSFPVIRKDSYRRAYGNTGVRVEGVGSFTSENLQDMDAIASQTLTDRRGRLLLKGGARLLAKGQLTEYAYDHFGPIAGLAANAYSAITETGDTRSWTLLPERFNITRMSLPTGKQKIHIESAGRVTDLRTVEIKKGKVLIIRD